MFPSNNSNPFTFSIDFDNNQSINCYLPNSPFNLSFFDFPSPFENYDENIFLEQTFHDFPFQFKHQSTLAEPEPKDKLVPIETKEKVGKKRGIRKDRHSKIKTARGMRDRRMRLSLQVAKRFFLLQDMLGFEKASKTVEWLLNQSKDEINQMAAAAAKSVSTSTFEGTSSLEEVLLVNEKKKKKRVRTKHCRKMSVFHHPLAKEFREKARERARERTKQKNIRRTMQCEDELGSWNSFSDKSVVTEMKQILNSSCDLVTSTEELSSLSLSEENFGSLEAMMHIDHNSLVFSTHNDSRVLLQETTS